MRYKVEGLFSTEKEVEGAMMKRERERKKRKGMETRRGYVQK